VLSRFAASWFGHRTIYLWGTATNLKSLFILGIFASVLQIHQTSYARACLGVIISFVLAGTISQDYHADAQYDSIKPRKQVLLHLGKYRLRLLDDGILLFSLSETPLLP